MLLSLTEQESLELAKRLQEDNYPGIPWEEPENLRDKEAAVNNVIKQILEYKENYYE